MSGLNIRSGWLWAAILVTVLKLWLTNSQTVFAIGPAFHDDQLFVKLAAHIINGEWLGPYDQFTLAKGPLFPLFIAATFWIGLPLIFAQQLFYAGACTVLTVAMRPWLRNSALQCGFYLLLLLNPISYDAANLTRLMRQNLYTPLALLTIAGLIMLFSRRRETVRRMFFPAILAGLSFGGFWLTREESVWLLPAVGATLSRHLGIITPRSVSTLAESHQWHRHLRLRCGITYHHHQHPELAALRVVWNRRIP